MLLKDFQILSVFWGDKHVEWFEKATLNSLAFPQNKEALLNATWNIFTEEKYFERIDEIVNQKVKLKKLNIIDIKKLYDRIDILHSGLIWQMHKCFELKEKMLLAPPDTIFGDGTISNLLKIGWEPGSCVVVAHPRVLPIILGEIYQSNESLVSASIKHFHKSWSDAEVGHPRQNGFIGGVSWQYLDKETISVCHRLPTVYLADFQEQDLKYFENRIGFGSYDHEWPSDHLINQERMRFVGSSDACFICEITDAGANIPPVQLNQDPNKFWRNVLHNKIDSQFRAIFRKGA